MQKEKSAAFSRIKLRRATKRTGSFVHAAASGLFTSVVSIQKKHSVSPAAHPGTLTVFRTIEPPRSIVLNNKDRDRFINEINNPAEPSEALFAAAKKFGYR